MSDPKETWTQVDRWYEDRLQLNDPVLDAALAASNAAGLPPISVTAAQGKLLQMLVALRGATRILEIGTLGGYSTIWMARALPPSGWLLSLEINPEHAALARDNIARAGLGDRVEVRVAPAAESLAALVQAGVEPFDLVFIDADKASSDAYVAFALKLSRPGTILVVDNVVRDGAITQPAPADADIRGLQQMLPRFADQSRIATTVIQTVGSKGYDGLLIAVVGG